MEVEVEAEVVELRHQVLQDPIPEHVRVALGQVISQFVAIKAPVQRVLSVAGKKSGVFTVESVDFRGFRDVGGFGR